MSKYILINKDTGFALRNLPSAKWNNGKHKKLTYWTFAGLGRPANEKAIAHLNSHGYMNLEFVELTEDAADSTEKAATDNQVACGKIAPRNIDEAKKFFDFDSEENKELLKEINYKCVTCSKKCKQNALATIYQCPLYERVSNL